MGQLYHQKQPLKLCQSERLFRIGDGPLRDAWAGVQARGGIGQRSATSRRLVKG